VPTGEQLTRRCPHCGANPAVFTILGQNETRDGGGRKRAWYMAGCPGCGGAVVMEDRGIDIQVFPEVTGEWAVKHLPPAVSNTWDEAVLAHQTGLPSATVVMCGRTLETAFDARQVAGSSLADRLGKAENQGLITKEFKGSLSYARLMRNVGAHAGDPVSPESAAGVMNFTLQTLRLLFEVPGELDRLTTPPEVAGEEDATNA
jgi:Domain of unknown function (DUF4145)